MFYFPIIVVDLVSNCCCLIEIRISLFDSRVICKVTDNWHQNPNLTETRINSRSKIETEIFFKT
jgi:hypothetical protein